MSAHSADATINQWGNDLAVRLNKAVAKAAGVAEGTPVRIVAEPGRIIIETTVKKKSLNEMLQAFSLELHGGELMATSGPAGEEII
jgi:antitoxin MazE